MGRVRSKETKQEQEQTEEQLSVQWESDLIWLSSAGTTQFDKLKSQQLFSTRTQLMPPRVKQKQTTGHWCKVFSFQNISEKRSRCKNLKTLEN